MSLKKEDVWAELRYALDELERPPLDIGARLTAAADLDAQPTEEFHKRLLQIGMLSSAYSKAKLRSDGRIAHEAIEKGLKAILLGSGLSERQVRSRGHQLQELLGDVGQHAPTAFDELKRCFDSTLEFLGSVTGIERDTDILDYVRKHGKTEVFVANRYASIESDNRTDGGMIGLVYMEMIRALSSLTFDWSPKDISQRLEKVARKAITAESERDPAWDAAEWLDRGPVRPRLEDIEQAKDNKVLRAAVRRCARDSKDSGIRYWAEWLRREYLAARKAARVGKRSG